MELKQRELEEDADQADPFGFELEYGVSLEEMTDGIGRLSVGRCVGRSAQDRLPPLLLSTFISLAQRNVQIKSLEWEVWEDIWEGDYVGSFVWKVQRDDEGGVSLFEDGTTLAPAYCRTTKAESYLAFHCPTVPLFGLSADFKPKFFLDDFVVRRA